MTASVNPEPGHNVGGLLRQIMGAERFAARKEVVPDATRRQTALGVPLICQEDGTWRTDVSNVRVFVGLAAFTHSLAHDIIDQSLASAADLMIQRRVDAEVTPELAALGLALVTVYARGSVAGRLARAQSAVFQGIRFAFVVVQGGRWGGVLFPACFATAAEKAGREDVQALLFPFQAGAENRKEDFILLMEYDAAGKFLRLTIEDASASRLFLKRIPHRVVPGMPAGGAFQDVRQTADTAYQGIYRAIQNLQDEHFETPESHPALFERLAAAGLNTVTEVKFTWFGQDACGALGLEDRNSAVVLLAKVLFLVGDPVVTELLAAGHVIAAGAGRQTFYLDLSRHGACLNIGYGRRRPVARMERYLEEMPALRAAAQAAGAIYTGYRVLLVHHVTAEVLALIRALDEAGAAFIRTLFIRYKGLVPDSHLEAMLSLPENRFAFHALQKIEARELVEGYYVFSRMFSPLGRLAELDAGLRRERLDFYAAMRRVALELFMAEVRAARAVGQQLLLIEDGGYVAPVVHTAALAGRTVGEMIEEWRLDPGAVVPAEERAQPLAEWLTGVVPGALEHTRNGLDANAEVEGGFGRLAFPVCSIAISKLKNTEEARECATAILHAIESILHGLGRIVSSRHALVIGCRGNIGRNLMQQLGERLTQGRLCGVDRVVPPGGVDRPYMERRTLAELPDEALLDLDLLIGAVGHSVLDTPEIEKLILHGRRPAVFFASGSTKNLEFIRFSHWLQELQSGERTSVNGVPVRVETAPINDPQTGLNQGRRIRFSFPAGGAALPVRDFYLLADLMPVNFLYYGVPG